MCSNRGNRAKTHVYFLLAIVTIAHAQTYTDVIAAKTDILSHYDKSVRPTYNQSDPIDISLGLVLHSIMDVNTVDGTMTMTITLFCEWIDQSFIWTPSDYNNVTELLINQEDVWTPPITLGSPVEFKVMGKPWMHVMFQHNGYAVWQPGDMIKIACTYNLKHWPFDKQTCDVFFVVYDYPQYLLIMEASSFFTKLVYTNSEWWIHETSTYAGIFGSGVYAFSAVTFRLKIVRFSIFYVITIILPLIAIGALNSIVFLLPSEAGERVGYSITILLSNTVFLTVIAQYLPMASDPLPLVCYVLILSLCLSFLTVLFVILNLSIYHRKKGQKISRWYHFIAYIGTSRRSKVDNTTDDINKVEVMNINVPAIYDDTAACFPDKEEESDAPLTWREVSRAIDNILFIILTCMHTIPTSSVIIYLTGWSKYENPGQAVVKYHKEA